MQHAPDSALLDTTGDHADLVERTNDYPGEAVLIVDALADIMASPELRRLQRQCHLRAKVDPHSWEAAVVRGDAQLRARVARRPRPSSRARGAGRPAARRAIRTASSSDGDDGPAEPAPPLTPGARAEAQRILDRAARRILVERMAVEP